MNTLQIDKPFIALLLSLIAQVLVSAGLLDPANKDSFVQLGNVVVGGIIAAVAIASFFEHHTQIKKAEIAAQGKTNTTTISTTPTSITESSTTQPTQ